MKPCADSEVETGAASLSVCAPAERRLLIAYGTSAEWIKLEPLLSAFDGRIPYRLLFTGQHEHCGGRYDRRLAICTEGNRLDAVVSSILQQPTLLADSRGVLVQGDTASAFAVAIAAFHAQLPIVHLEAGIRSHDLSSPFPEEFYRRCISQLAGVHLCPGTVEYQHLVREHCEGEKFIVGNTVLDHWKDILPSYGNQVVVTLHRREGAAQFAAYLEELDRIAGQETELEYLFVRHHSNPPISVRHIRCISPLSHAGLRPVLAAARFVITDSGGLQEEAAFLGKRCVVCRSRSDRRTRNCVWTPTPGQLESAVHYARQHFEVDRDLTYGDGHAAEKVAAILQREKWLFEVIGL